ncbi:RES family NAD+ phosphorylase [Salinarimonas ramus]|uniref:RES domain-containing protein n=1 Tax=Salinarimonas ramus TaxID=690164 RepID=A0A917V6P1_9HYPH|nr:RES family NAD+ phosphorylase [Salinarimonas ramus]GGK45143.1 hypothetical protein GCM10011322_35390 [Salinarimonas ramus]
MTLRRAPAPAPCHRLIPSRFPPIALFERVASAADLEAVMDLEGWTNDRLVAQRVARLPRDEWAYGRANASAIMASFLHVAPGGMRFNGPDLGAWYAAAAIRTAIAEVAHHLRREAIVRGEAFLTRPYRAYQAALSGEMVDLRGERASRPDLYAATSYAASQAFGESLRAGGESGVVYDSLRHAGGENVVGFRPSRIRDVVQTDHWEITVRKDAKRISARRLRS